MKMRRSDRAIDNKDSLKILQKGEYGILGTISLDGKPYCLPLNYCLLENKIYFHCADQGHKLNNLRANPNVSFTVVGNTEVEPGAFSTFYESIIIDGSANEVFGDTKQKALEELIYKYSPEFEEQGMKYIRSMFDKTVVIEIEICSISGKAKKR